MPTVTDDTNAAKLDAILDELHALRQLVHNLTVPVACLSRADAAQRLGVGARTLTTLTAQGIFSDGRAPERRTAGTARVYFADELDVYRSEGAAGVARLRRELGRN